MERLNALVEKFFTMFSNELISPVFLKNAVRATFGNRSLSAVELEAICVAAKTHWLTEARRRFHAVCNEVDLANSFEKLDELIAQQSLSRKKEVGWERGGDVEADTYGSRRDIKLDYIARLKAKNSELEQVLREKKDKLAKSNKELHDLIEQI